MQTNYRLAASIICANLLNLEDEIKQLTESEIDYIHFDVMDGIFVPRFGLPPEVLKFIRSISSIPVDAHMMVSDPEPYIKEFASSGTSIFCVHAEATIHLDRVIRSIRASGMKAGVALNPSTPLDVLNYVLDDIALVTVMAINPGIVGHKLIPSAMNKITELKNKLKNHPDIIIEIDGGVTPDTSAEMIRNGATMLVCGTSTIFKPPTPIHIKTKELRATINSSLSL